jgi:DNA-directed RNA polymerase subunit alpha
MSKRLGKFELPHKLTKDEEKSSATFGTYTAEPFETGYGHTFGNTFRRVLLGSIEGAAIASAKIEGVHHEFQSVEGVVEDVTDIVLNLKKILLKSNSRETIRVIIDTEKEGAITAADIQPDSRIQVVNPNQVICTLDRKKRFRAELEIKVGRGYYPAELNKAPEQIIGLIPVDCLFSPVTLVNYKVESTRVGQMTNFDKLILEITTDGRISPDEALKEATVIIRHHLSVFDQVSDDKIEFTKEGGETNDEYNRLRELLNMSVNEMELSVRAANCLNNAQILTIGQLISKSEQEMLKYRNFGKKSLNEIKERLEKLGLSLGMKIDERLLDKQPKGKHTHPQSAPAA